jgi:glycosyltransferase involved in cell wall biosynthesis
MNVWYLPLEAYRERYTEQLGRWTTGALEARSHDVQRIFGMPLGPALIQTGVVLDAYGRCHWALTQMATLVAHLAEVQDEDVIWMDDLFQPGYEALPYILSQTGRHPTIVTRNWAQSMDPDDFTFAMRDWMRPFEQIVARTATLVLVASTCHKEMWEAAGLGGRVEVVGLPFSVHEARTRLGEEPIPWRGRERIVVYSSRLDREKQPHFLFDVIEWIGQRDPSVAFQILTGSATPRSNDPTVLARLPRVRGNLSIHAGLDKLHYYQYLADARVQLNTARQDFVSFTAVEASAFGTPTLAPAFRSFPEALENRASQLYVPWSVPDCGARLLWLLGHGEPLCGQLAAYHDQTLNRTIGLLEAS